MIYVYAPVSVERGGPQRPPHLHGLLAGLKVLTPYRQHINIPKTHAKEADDQILGNLALRCPKRLLSLQLNCCTNISTFRIMEVLLTNRQLQEVYA